MSFIEAVKFVCEQSDLPIKVVLSNDERDFDIGLLSEVEAWSCSVRHIVYHKRNIVLIKFYLFADMEYTAKLVAHAVAKVELPYFGYKHMSDKKLKVNCTDACWALHGALKAYLSI